MFTSINLPLRTAFAESHSFGILWFVFIHLKLFSFDFLFDLSFWFPLWPIGCLRLCGLISTYLWISRFSSFIDFLSYSFVISFYCCQRRYFISFQYFKPYWNLFYGPTHSMLKNVLYPFGNNVSPAVCSWSVLYVCLWFSWFIMSFKSYISLFIFCLVVLFWRRQWHPTPVLLPGKSHGCTSLVGCSPWGR